MANISEGTTRRNSGKRRYKPVKPAARVPSPYTRGVDFGIRRALGSSDYPGYPGGTPTPGVGVGGPAMPEDSESPGGIVSWGPYRNPQPDSGVSRSPVWASPPVATGMTRQPAQAFNPPAVGLGGLPPGFPTIAALFGGLGGTLAGPSRMPPRSRSYSPL